jgi:hypothetical protein
MIFLTLIGFSSKLGDTVSAKIFSHQISALSNNPENHFYEDFSDYSINNLQYTTGGQGTDLFMKDADPATYEGSGWNTPFLGSYTIPENLKTNENIYIYLRMRTNSHATRERGGFLTLIDSNDYLHAFGIGIGSLGTYIRSDLSNNTEIAFNYRPWSTNKWIWFKLHSYKAGPYRVFELSYNLNENSTNKPEIWIRDETLDNISSWYALKRIGVYVSHWKSASTIQKWEFDDLEITTDSPETTTPETTTNKPTIGLITPLNFDYLFFLIMIVAAIRRRNTG